MNTINAAEFARNYGFWNESEQQAILDKRVGVAIGGVGGDGYQLGLSLARMGVQQFDIADPEVFEPENANRVPGATTSTYGRKKAEVFREQVLDINPNADIRIFEGGVTAENAEEFVSRASLVFDETELTYLHVGTALARAARARNIPNTVVLNIGFGAQITSFKPDSKMTFETFMGLPKDMPLDEMEALVKSGDLKVDFSRSLAYLPKYVSMSTLQEVQNGAPLPSVIQGVNQAVALATTEAFFHLAGGLNNNRPQPTWAPKVSYMDSYTRTGGTTRFPRLSYFRRSLHMALRDKIGLNPQASYTVDDRAKRKANLALEQS